jgi:hypothetical protein
MSRIAFAVSITDLMKQVMCIPTVLAWFLVISLGATARAEGPRLVLPVTPVAGLSVTISVGDGSQRLVQVDTGSVGLIVWRGDIGPAAVPQGPGKREYNSSGRIFRGTYFLTWIAFQTPGGTVQTVRLRVLGVDRQDCDPAKPDCRAQEGAALQHVGVLGVGFDRPAYTQGDVLDQSDNPFLNLEPMRGGRMPRRYILSTHSVELGGTASLPAGFHTLSLTIRTPGQGGAPDDWARPTGCYTLTLSTGRSIGPFCTKLLVDSGLPEMILTLPPAQRPAGLACDTRCPDGLQVTVRAGNALNWEFTTGEPGAPRYVRWGLNGSTTQINTGRALLEHFDYLYDADLGVVGFRPASH